MKKTYTIFCFCLLMIQMIHAQNGSISGIIADSLKKPIPNATVQLFSDASNMFLKGTFTSSKGKFVFEDVLPGNYRIEINHISYALYFLDISLKTGEQKDLGTIKLETQVNTLNEITINGKKLAVKHTADKITINIASNVLGAGGTAIDVLKQLPIVSISSEGNISIKGKSDIQILINGKPSGFAAIQGQSYLDQIDLSTVERIEVITNPSIIQSTSGSGGVINIITKKNNENGFKARFNTGIGSDDWYHFSTGLSYRVDSVNFFLDYRIRNSKRKAESYNLSKRIVMAEELNIVENKTGIRNDKRHNAEFGMDYHINDKQYVTLALNYSYRDKKDAQNKQTTVKNNTNILETRIGKIGEPETNKNWGMFANYSKSGSKNKSTTMLLDYVHSVEDEAISREEDVTTMTKNFIDGIKSNYTDINDRVLLDFEKKTVLKNQSKLSYGVQAVYRKIKQNFSALNFDIVDNNYVRIPESIDEFNYQDFTSAIYFQNEHTIKQFSYEVALKLELLSNNYKSEALNTSFKEGYFKFFPSFKLTYGFNEKSSSVLSFRKGINRPSPNRLNPFPDVSNAFSISIGNPELKPEIFYNTELGIQTKMNKAALNAGLFFTVYDGLIQRVSELRDDSIVYIIPININKMYHYGIDFNIQMKFTTWWNQQFGSLFYNRVYKDDFIEKSKKIAYQFKTTSSFEITDAIETQILGSYTAPENTPQGNIDALWFMDAAIEYEFLKKRGKLSFTVSDIFNSLKETTSLTTMDLNSESWQKLNSRRVYLTFNYKL